MANSEPGEIKASDIQDALSRSGYLLESRLHSLLTRRDYLVYSNRTYPVGRDGGPRELDLDAWKSFMKEPSLDVWIGSVMAIECINNPQPLVLFVNPKQPRWQNWNSWNVKVGGIPAKGQSDDSKGWMHLADYLDMEDSHHYNTDRLATQYCSFSVKKNVNQWMAYHEEEQHNTFDKLTRIAEHLENRSYTKPPIVRPDIHLDFIYPVLVVQGPLMEARPHPARNGAEVRTVQHGQYYHEALINGRESGAQIDVVTERGFREFVSLLGKEFKMLTRKILAQEKEFKRAALLLTKQAARLRSPLKIKDVLGWGE